MTSESPRIYTYKITFEEVPYYYYGSKKETKYNEYYMGSPVTNKWCWELYTPKKQILEFFPYTDEGYMECRKLENRLIKSFLNDHWCLNERYGGVYSLSICRKTGKINGMKAKEQGLGFHSLTFEERSEISKRNAMKNQENKVGIFALTFEERSKNSRKTALKNVENKVGIFSQTKEQLIENGKKGAEKCKELGVGIYSQSAEKMRENGKKTNSQRWMCEETGYISTPAGLSKYQKARGIDTSKKVRVL